MHAWSQEMANGLTNQYSLIINSFGFTVLQTTLLGTVSGAVSFVCLITAAIVLHKTTVSYLQTWTYHIIIVSDITDGVRMLEHGYRLLHISPAPCQVYFYWVSISPNNHKSTQIAHTCHWPGLPWSNRWGLITGIWIRSTTGIAYAVVMIWAANTAAGHTKKTTVIALYHIGYGLGNIISPQLFRPQWKVCPWLILSHGSWLILILRHSHGINQHGSSYSS